MSFGTLKTLVSVGKNISNEYTVPVCKSLEKKEKYEVRLYERNRYIIYKYKTIDSKKTADKSSAKKNADDDPVMKNVWRLMKYTQGENEKNLNMKLYMPVFVHIETLNSEDSNSDGEVEVLVKIMVTLPPEFQIGKEDPPKPNDPELEFEIFEEFKCFVRTFSGFADDQLFKSETEKLKKDVKESNLNINVTKCICIAYDPPYKLFGRRNEVIVLSSD